MSQSFGRVTWDTTFVSPGDYSVLVVVENLVTETRVRAYTAPAVMPSLLSNISISF